MSNLSKTVRDIRKYRALAQHPYAWPGGYAILFLMDDGGVLCPSCVLDPGNPVHVNGQPDGWRIEVGFVHWEGPPDYCSHCNRKLPSEYGAPDVE